jgi:hypothetical protein
MAKSTSTAKKSPKVVTTSPPTNRYLALIETIFNGGFKHEAQRGAWVWILLAAAL